MNNSTAKAKPKMTVKNGVVYGNSLSAQEKKRIVMQRKKDRKAKKVRKSAQQTIPYLEMCRDGICKVNSRLYDVMLVLDGSTGQNAFEQAKQFTLATEVTSMAITKLDGTAKGGVVIGISDQFKIPVRYIGLGEGVEDLQPFNRKEFVKSLFGNE